jgi:chromosomal replication initiation ATPase DnaA
MKSPCENLASASARAPRSDCGPSGKDPIIEAARIEIRAFLADLGRDINRKLDVLQNRFWRHEIATLNSYDRASQLNLIAKAVAESFSVAHSALFARRRTVVFVEPRHAAMYLSHVLTKCTLNAIGLHFGRDHGTVLYAIQSAKDRMATDPAFKSKIEALEKQLRDELSPSAISNLQSQISNSPLA